MHTFWSLPRPVLVAIGVVGVIQLSLQIWGLVDLSRREVVQGGRKWVWAVAITLGGLVGAISYLAVGRKVYSTIGIPESERLSDRSGRARQETIDRLYGKDS